MIGYMKNIKKNNSFETKAIQISENKTEEAKRKDLQSHTEIQTEKRMNLNNSKDKEESNKETIKKEENEEKLFYESSPNNDEIENNENNISKLKTFIGKINNELFDQFHIQQNERILIKKEITTNINNLENALKSARDYHRVLESSVRSHSINGNSTAFDEKVQGIGMNIKLKEKECLEEEISTMKEEIESYKIKTKEFEYETESLMTMNTNMKPEIKQLKTNIEDIKNEIKTIKAGIVLLKKPCDYLKENINKQDSLNKNFLLSVAKVYEFGSSNLLMKSHT
jgi:hypothetical protein